MTYHYVNLVSWRYFIENRGGRLYCDSILLYLVALLNGIKLTINSGPNEFYNVNSRADVLVLGNRVRMQTYDSFHLPLWRDICEIALSDELQEKVKDYRYIYIGISSPKQDRLAHLLEEKYSNKEIYCFGAAMYTNGLIERLERYGLMWLGFLFTKPRRTFRKYWISFISIYQIFTNSKTRNDFRVVMNLIQNGGK